MDDRWFRLGDRGRYHAMPPNPYSTPRQQGEISDATPSDKQKESGVGIYLMMRMIVVFFVAWALVAGVATALTPMESIRSSTFSSAALKLGIPIGCLLIAIALTALDTIQFLRKRGSSKFWF